MRLPQYIGYLRYAERTPFREGKQRGGGTWRGSHADLGIPFAAPTNKVI